MKRRRKKRFNIRIRLLYSTLTLAVLVIGIYCVSLSYSQEDTSTKLEGSTDSYPFTVIDCNDGDTCKIEISGISFNVRLADIDAPELSHRKATPSQPFARQSTDKINELVKGKHVSLTQISTDMYNRPIVEMIDESGQNINLTMLELGLAELYQGGRKAQPKKPEYTQAEKKAKQARLGIWSLPVSSYISPYDYRRQNSNRTR